MTVLRRAALTSVAFFLVFEATTFLSVCDLMAGLED